MPSLAKPPREYVSPATPPLEAPAPRAPAPAGDGVTPTALIAESASPGRVQQVGQPPSVLPPALRSLLMEHAQTALLQQATDYCVAVTDWATQSVFARLAEPQQRLASLGQSLLAFAAAQLPGSRAMCSAALDQLQDQAKALLASVQAAWFRETAPGTLALAEPQCTSRDAADPSVHLPGCPDPGARSAQTPPTTVAQEPAMPREASASVLLVGTWDAADAEPLA